MKKDLPKIIVVCGPTGSGKTSLAVLLCKKFGGEIINADSRQVYREMDIGTAKGLDKISNIQYPISNQCPIIKYTIQGILVHLVDIVNPDEKYSVGQFKIDAEAAVSDIISRGKVPFIVGGTGLYIDALVENFKFQITNNKQISNSKIQKISQYLNISISDFKNKSLEDLIKILEKLDPQALTVVDLKNRRRVERAIEVCLTTGIPFTKQRTKGKRKYDVLKLSPAVSLDREKLHKKINKRVDEMIEEGLEEEVKMLAEKYGWESEAMTGIGYREWKEYLENIQYPISNIQSISNSQTPKERQDIVNLIKQSTRNYAKRQITWFKRDKEINYVDLKKAEKLVKKFLKN